MASNNTSKTNNNSGSTSKDSHPRERIEDHGLVRKSVTVKEDKLEMFEKYLGKGPYNWQFASVHLPPKEDGKDGDLLNLYVMSHSHHAYVTLNVSLTQGEDRGDKRVTKMKYRYMTIDNIITTAGGEEAAATNRFLGTKCIINDPAREIIEECFRAQGRDMNKPCTIEVAPGDKCYEKCLKTNPFARGHRCMLLHRHDAVSCACIKRFIFISEGAVPGKRIDFMNPPLHFLCELRRAEKSSTDPVQEKLAGLSIS